MGVKSKKLLFRIPKNMSCSIMGCGRKATRYLMSKSHKHRYMCDSCHRAYSLGRSSGYHNKRRKDKI